MHSDTELQRAVDRLAERLGMPLVLEDADQQLIVHSPHEDLIDDMRRSSILRRATSRATVDYFDEWDVRNRTAPLLVAGSDDGKVLPRLCLPLHRDGRTLGLVWGLLAAHVVEEPSVEGSEELVAELIRALEQTFDEGALRSELVDLLLSPLQDQRMAAAARIAERPSFGSGHRFCIVVCEGELWNNASVRRSFWNTPLSNPGDGQLKALRPDRGVALLSSMRPDVVDRAVLDAAVATVCRAADGAATLLAFGDTVDRLADARASYEDAVRTARSAAALGTTGVVSWSEQGALRFLLRLDDDELRASIDPRVAELVAQDELVAETLARYLAAAGSVKQVAEEMHVHRATLHQRLERLERFGLDLRSGEDRLAAHVSFLAIRFLQRG